MRFILEFAAYTKKPIQPITLLIKDRNDKVIQSIDVDVDMLGKIRKAIRKALSTQSIFNQWGVVGKSLYDKRIVSTPQGEIDTEYVALMPNNLTVLHRIVYKALKESNVINNSQDLLDYIERNYSMFMPNDRFFWSLYSTTSGKKEKGDIKESDAETFFKEFASSKGINVNLRKQENREADALEGEDLLFDHNGKVFTIQVKTLNTVEPIIEDGVEYYKVVISGDYTQLWDSKSDKEKKGVDYFIGMSDDENYPNYIFRAKDSITMPGFYLFPKSNFVYKG